MQDPNWRTAMNDEFSALTKHKTWDLVPRPRDVNFIRCMWLFKHKFHSVVSLEQNKARLFVNGRSHQLTSIDNPVSNERLLCTPLLCR